MLKEDILTIEEAETLIEKTISKNTVVSLNYTYTIPSLNYTLYLPSNTETNPFPYTQKIF